MEFTNSIIERCTIERTEQDNLPDCVREQGKNFALLKIKTKKIEMTKTPTFLLFSIDKTGSMHEYGGSTGTKLDYVKFTFKNMIRYLANITDAEIYIRVHAFDEKVDVLIDAVQVTLNNVVELIEKIDSLQADGMTAIDLALTTANDAVTEYSINFPTHQLGHIFMTDGEPSKGEMKEAVLAGLVNDSYPNIFVGFGSGHNVSLLRSLSTNKKGDYHYVDNPESTVLIYGETIHQFLYPAVRNVRISARDSLIYDWQTNTWVSEIEEDVLIGEMEKVYHLKEADDSLYDAEVNVYGEEANAIIKNSSLLATGFSIPNLLSFEGVPLHNRDFTNYVFRQKVFELLFKVKNNKMTFVEKRQLKKELKDFFKEMRIYMKESDKMDDPLMKNLCDDISIVYHTLGKRDGLMFTLARQSTHGKQKVYTPSSSRAPTQEIYRMNATDEYDSQEPMTPRAPSRPMLQRTNTMGSQMPPPPPFPDMSDDEDEREENQSNVATQVDSYGSDEDIEKYNTNTTTESCYAAAPVLNTIRTMSQR